MQGREGRLRRDLLTVVLEGVRGGEASMAALRRALLLTFAGRKEGKNGAVVHLRKRDDLATVVVSVHGGPSRIHGRPLRAFKLQMLQLRYYVLRLQKTLGKHFLVNSQTLKIMGCFSGAEIRLQSVSLLYQVALQRTEIHFHSFLLFLT